MKKLPVDICTCTQDRCSCVHARGARRSAGGYQIVELLIAIGIITTLMAAIMDGLSQLYRQNTSSSNNTVAMNITQTLIDHARNMRWSELTAASNVELNVDRESASDNGPVTIMQRPVLLDFQNFRYNTSAGNQEHRFRGRVFWTMQDISNDTKRLTVTVTYPEQNGKNRTISTQTLLYQFGIGND